MVPFSILYVPIKLFALCILTKVPLAHFEMDFRTLQGEREMLQRLVDGQNDPPNLGYLTTQVREESWTDVGEGPGQEIQPAIELVHLV